MKKIIFPVFLFFLVFLIVISCNKNSEDNKIENKEVSKKENNPKEELPTSVQRLNTQTCGGSYGSGSGYSVINSYYTYPLQAVDVSCDSVGATITVDVQALDVPNRFVIVDQNNNYVAGTGWLGSASYSGYFGPPFSNSGNAQFTFTRAANKTYFLKVETHTPPNYSYSPTTDGWWAGVSCTCRDAYPCPECCVPDCDNCGGSFGGTYTTLNTYYTYPLQLVDVTCTCPGDTITVDVQALDIPNRFVIVDQNNNYVAGTGWLGSASYSGYFGPPFSNSGNAQFYFITAANTVYYLKVETHTAPNGSYSPSTDGWWAGVTCEE